MSTIPDEYLGDGVYASDDGYHIWLDVRGQSEPSIRYVDLGGEVRGIPSIALDPFVLTALQRYVGRVEAARKELQK